MPRPTDHAGRRIDFGKTVDDYDRHRPGFPASMFDRLAARGWIAAGIRALDAGTGTGSLALGLAQRGLDVVGLDPAPELLAVARRRAIEAGHSVEFVEGVAEATGQADASFDLYAAGQCWWWIDAPRALAEARRVLRPGGRVLLANFCYLPTPGSIAARTEDIVLVHNPGWPKAGESGLFDDQVLDLDAAGLRRVESFSYIEPVEFSHEAWRGRIRACNGVGATLRPAQVEAFDRDLAAMLAAEFPGPLHIPHRVFLVSGCV